MSASATDLTILVIAVSFIVVLIILAKISSQIDSITNMVNTTQRKIRENYEVTKWDFDKIKEKMAELRGEDISEYMNKKIEGKTNEVEIDWKG